MADTVVEIDVPPGSATTAYLVSRGGTGTPNAGGYTLTQVTGYLHTITIPEALVGWFRVSAGSLANPVADRDVYLVDEDTTIRLYQATEQALKTGVLYRWTRSGGSTDYDDVTVTEAP